MLDTQETIEDATILLKAIANTKRLEILYLLNDEQEKSVGDILQHVDLAQSALSQHLARLRKHGMVQTRRDAQTIYYSLKSDKLKTLLHALRDLYSYDDQRDAA